MKNVLTLIAFSLLLTTSLTSQSSKVYYSVSGEMIFSWASIEDQGNEASSLMRWVPVFILQSFIKSDLSPNLGIVSGLAIRNV